MGNTDQIRRVSQGDELSAERDAQILEAIDRKWSGVGSVTDYKGTALSASFKRRICRFEMVDELLLPQSGSGTADAYFLSWAEGALGNLTGIEDKTIKVVDTMRCHSKMETESPDVGAYGLAWVPDDPLVHDPYYSHWEIITMQTPGDFVGFLASGELLQAHNTTPPAGGDQAWVTPIDVWGDPGHRTFGGYDPFGVGWLSSYNDGGTPPRAVVTVYNLPREDVEVPPGTTAEYYWFEAEEGQFVYCRWHMRENRYYVVGMPGNLWVTGADIGAVVQSEKQTIKIAFDTSDFVVTAAGDGSVSVALR